MSDNGCQPTSVSFVKVCSTMGIHQAFTSYGNPKGFLPQAMNWIIETGTMLDSHNLDRAFRAAREKAGLSDFRFHDLRHTAGNRMAQSGVDIYTIAKILGHTTLTMTMRYSHHDVESLRHGVGVLSSG